MLSFLFAKVTRLYISTLFSGPVAQCYNAETFTSPLGMAGLNSQSFIFELNGLNSVVLYNRSTVGVCQGVSVYDGYTSNPKSPLGGAAEQISIFFHGIPVSRSIARELVDLGFCYCFPFSFN